MSTVIAIALSALGLIVMAFPAWTLATKAKQMTPNQRRFEWVLLCLGYVLILGSGGVFNGGWEKPTTSVIIAVQIAAFVAAAVLFVLKIRRDARHRK